MAGPWERYSSAAPVIQTKPADPTTPYKGPAAAADLQATNLANRLKEKELAKPTLIGESGYMLDPKTGRAVPVPGLPPKPLTDSQIAERDKMGNLRALERQMKRIADLYRKGPGATEAWSLSSLLDYAPTDANRAFNTASEGIGDVAFGAFRVPGAGSQSDAELKARLAATRPYASDNDATINEKFNYLQNRLAEAYRARGVNFKPILLDALKKPAPRKQSDGWKIEEVR